MNPEFITLTVVFVLALISPGPDFFVIIRQSLTRDFRAGVFCSLGIGAGLIIHGSYCMAGLAFVISESIAVFNILKFIGAAYLIYIGIKSLRSKGFSADGAGRGGSRECSRYDAFKLGFFTNLLNPKAALFLASLFSVVISKDAMAAAQIFYVLWMAFLAVVWFVFLSYCFAGGVIRRFYMRFSKWADRALGGILIVLGIELALFRRG